MTTGKTIALTRWTFVGQVMSLLFNMLSSLVIAFLLKTKKIRKKKTIKVNLPMVSVSLKDCKVQEGGDICIIMTNLHVVCRNHDNIVKQFSSD